MGRVGHCNTSGTRTRYRIRARSPTYGSMPGRGPTVASAGDADGTAGHAVTAGAVLGRGQRPEDAESGRRGGPDGCIGRTKPIAQRPDSNPVPAWDFSKPGIRRAVPGHDPYAPHVRTPPYRTDTDPMATPQASGAVSRLPPMAAGDHPPLESPFTSGHCPACRTFRRNFPCKLPSALRSARMRSRPIRRRRSSGTPDVPAPKP